MPLLQRRRWQWRRLRRWRWHDGLSEAEAAPLVGQLTTALQHLQRHGIAHRDLKPSNVLFSRLKGCGVTPSPEVLRNHCLADIVMRSLRCLLHSYLSILAIGSALSTQEVFFLASQAYQSCFEDSDGAHNDLQVILCCFLPIARRHYGQL